MRDAGFFVYSRKRKTQKPLYYARFRLSDGTWTAGKNTGCTNREAAEIWAQEQIDTGKVGKPAGPNPTLDGWAAGFYGVDGRYDKAKKARGYKLSACYLENIGRSYRKYLSPAFGPRKIVDITALELETFFLDLYNDHEPKLAGSTVNGVLRSVRALFGEAERLGVIRNNPAKRFGRFAENNRERGTLSQTELNDLFSIDALSAKWDNERAPYLIAMIAVACGLRHGEVVALRPTDFDGEILSVNRAWNRASNSFGPPKWGSVREVPVPERIRDEIESYIADRHIDEQSLLFPSTDPSRPIEAHSIMTAFRDALEKIGIFQDQQSRKNRFLDLHSLRHTYITRSRAAGVPEWETQAAVGHKSSKVTDGYLHPKGTDLKAVRDMKILPFPQRSA